jgi:hypothetical protein
VTLAAIASVPPSPALVSSRTTVATGVELYSRESLATASVAVRLTPIAISLPSSRPSPPRSVSSISIASLVVVSAMPISVPVSSVTELIPKADSLSLISIRIRSPSWAVPLGVKVIVPEVVTGPSARSLVASYSCSDWVVAAAAGAVTREHAPASTSTRIPIRIAGLLGARCPVCLTSTTASRRWVASATAI